MTGASYHIGSYFKAGKTMAWAEYVDARENGGNGNYRVDGEEIKLFTDIIKHRYNYDYDFSKLDSAQSSEIYELDEKNNNDIARRLYLTDGLENAWAVGYNISDKLGGLTRSYESLKVAMEKINTFPVAKQKFNVVKEFILGFHMGEATNGFFEQLGHEYGKTVTNKEVLAFLKTIMDVIPENKKETDDYKIINDFYNKYSQKDPNAKFEEKPNVFVRFFGCDELDNLDEAVENLLDI